MQFRPHQYQEAAAQFIVEHPKCGLFLDMGLGKTVTTLTALDGLMNDTFDITSGKILVIAPLRVAEHTWSTECQKWDHLKHLKISRVIGSEKQRLKALKEKADVYVIHRENLVWLVDLLGKNWNFNTVIVDELSSFKNSKSKRFRALKKVTPLFDRFIGLTGTPAPRSLLDLWPQLYLMDRGQRLGKTYTAYKDKYFTPGWRNGYVVYEWNLRPGAEEQIQEAIKDICMSLKAEDWLKLPERVNVMHEIELGETLMKKYRKFEREKLMELESSEALVASNAGVLAGKLTQFTSGAIYKEDKSCTIVHDVKLQALEDLVEASNGQPILIFYNFQHDKVRIKEQLKSYDIREIKSEKDIDDWNAGKVEILLAHPAAMGHGLNMQDGGHIIVWYSLTWDLELYQQANARLHRQGQKKSVLIHHLIAKNTIDEDIINKLTDKAAQQNDLIEAVKARIKKAGEEDE